MKGVVLLQTYKSLKAFGAKNQFGSINLGCLWPYKCLKQRSLRNSKFLAPSVSSWLHIHHQKWSIVCTMCYIQLGVKRKFLFPSDAICTKSYRPQLFWNLVGSFHSVVHIHLFCAQAQGVLWIFSMLASQWMHNAIIKSQIIALCFSICDAMWVKLKQACVKIIQSRSWTTSYKTFRFAWPLPFVFSPYPIELS